MNYVKHKYSKRVYQIMMDHGDGSPYLSQFPNVRYCSDTRMREFFTQCDGPTQDSKIPVLKEIEWEQKQIRGSEPIIVKAPLQKVGRIRRSGRTTTTAGGYTLKEICSELGISTSSARRILRSRGRAPEGGWRWSSSQEVEEVKSFLKNLR